MLSKFSVSNSRILLLGFSHQHKSLLIALVSNNQLRIFKYSSESLHPIFQFLTPKSLLNANIQFCPETENVFALDDAEKLYRFSVKEERYDAFSVANCKEPGILVPYLLFKTETGLKSEHLNSLSYTEPNISHRVLRDQIEKSRRLLSSLRQRQKRLFADAEFIRHVTNFSKNIDSPAIEVEIENKHNLTVVCLTVIQPTLKEIIDRCSPGNLILISFKTSDLIVNRCLKLKFPVRIPLSFKPEEIKSISILFKSSFNMPIRHGLLFTVKS